MYYTKHALIRKLLECKPSEFITVKKYQIWQLSAIADKTINNAGVYEAMDAVNSLTSV